MIKIEHLEFWEEHIKWRQEAKKRKTGLCQTCNIYFQCPVEPDYLPKNKMHVNVCGDYEQTAMAKAKGL